MSPTQLLVHPLAGNSRLLPPAVTGVEAIVWLVCALVVLAIVLMVRRETAKRRRAERGRLEVSPSSVDDH